MKDSEPVWTLDETKNVLAAALAVVAELNTPEPLQAQAFSLATQLLAMRQPRMAAVLPTMMMPRGKP